MAENSNSNSIVEISREGLISVPLATRPREGELRPYLKPFQAFIIGRALDVLKNGDLENSNTNLNTAADTLRKLVTALSTELRYIRVPVIWALSNKLVHMQKDVRERALEGTSSELDSIVQATGILLSHFDISRHLNEAETRVSMGDDTIDEALFVEIEERTMIFDKSRAIVFSDSAERTRRLDAVFYLQNGAVPSFTVFSYKLLDQFSSVFFRTTKTVFSAIGAAFLVGSLVSAVNSDIILYIGQLIAKLTKLPGL